MDSKEVEHLYKEAKARWEIITLVAELEKENNELKAENKGLKEEVRKRKMVADENWTGYDMMKDEYDKLEKENKELKWKLNLLTNK